jgi:GNAT superfamily N-acetyltransferase
MPGNRREIRERSAVVPLREVALTHAVIQELDSIFYEASGTQTFASPEDRAAFRELWLGSYLTFDRNDAFLALDQAGMVVGYVIGTLGDPALNPRYADLGYFRDFAALTPHYPAHLHINIAAQHRSQGIGARLVDAFADHAAAAGCPGLHVVTGAGLRNVSFYLRNGFQALAEAPWKTRTVVLLGRKL